MAPAPAVPVPVIPAPVIPAPVVPAPVVPAPVVPDSVIPAPVVPDSVIPAPVVPDSVIPALVAPAPRRLDGRLVQLTAGLVFFFMDMVEARQANASNASGKGIPSQTEAMNAAKDLFRKHRISLDKDKTAEVQRIIQGMQAAIRIRNSLMIIDTSSKKEHTLTRVSLAPLENLRKLVGDIFQEQSKEGQGST